MTSAEQMCLYERATGAEVKARLRRHGGVTSSCRNAEMGVVGRSGWRIIYAEVI